MTGNCTPLPIKRESSRLYKTILYLSFHNRDNNLIISHLPLDYKLLHSTIKLYTLICHLLAVVYICIPLDYIKNPLKGNCIKGDFTFPLNANLYTVGYKYI